MKIVKIDDTGLTFDNGDRIEDYHEQGCCEHVYADWKQLEDTDILAHEFKELVIEGVPDAGFRLDGYFVPCYNDQDGYYSDDLELEISKSGKKVDTIDISEWVKDNID